MNQNKTSSVQKVSAHQSDKARQKSQPFDRIAYKIGEAATSIGVDPVTIRRMIKRGLLKPYRGLRTPLIPVCQLKNLIEKGEEPKKSSDEINNGGEE